MRPPSLADASRRVAPGPFKVLPREDDLADLLRGVGIAVTPEELRKWRARWNREAGMPLHAVINALAGSKKGD